MTAAAATLEPVPAAPAVPLGWTAVARLGLAQACIGAVVVLMTSTLNRVMIVELGLPAVVPGALVALHFVVQLWLRPHLGFGSDASGRRSAWIAGGVAVLAASGVAASATTMVLATNRALGLALATLAFVGLGAGVSAAGTPLLALLADRVPAQRRATAAAVVWLMMIVGFIVTTVAASKGLAPYSHERLVQVTAMVGGIVTVLAFVATRGLDTTASAGSAGEAPARAGGFAAAARAVWDEPVARRFATFIFLSMLAYSAQDLILEPYAGLVFQLPPAESTRISGMHQGGLLLGMLACAALASRLGTPRGWAVWGCVASAVFFVLLALSPLTGSVPFLKVVIFGLGTANGAFAIGAISTMMSLAGVGDGQAGLRMGIYGAAQAVAYGIGGFIGAAGSDVARALLASVSAGYGAVFGLEALLFVAAAAFAARSAPVARPAPVSVRGGAEHVLAAMR